MCQHAKKDTFKFSIPNIPTFPYPNLKRENVFFNKN